MKVLLESQYLPSVAYFSLLIRANTVYIEANEYFEKQSYRNRCHIIGANKIQSLSIPVHHGGKKILMTDLAIDYKQKWMNNHWRAIQSAYGKAPFFDFYGDYIKDVFETNPGKLFDFNQTLLTLCLKLLRTKVEILNTESYQKMPPNDVIDMRSCIHPKKSLDSLTWFRPEPYHQIFGKDFVPNMSILDLLFCTGPDALDILYQSGSGLMNK
ncbi:WbqC family protein [Roseivirga sp.]|uniref:WbqC family protein n=1 Tax=Roseivirga sp. TaxID=1964215 RepID=UPI003B8E55D5